jgi:hypothetical protein
LPKRRPRSRIVVGLVICPPWSRNRTSRVPEMQEVPVNAAFLSGLPIVSIGTGSRLRFVASVKPPENLARDPTEAQERAKTDVARGAVLSEAMTRPLRALASLVVGLTTAVGMVVYQHYSREPPSNAFAMAVTMGASILAWLVTVLE